MWKPGERSDQRDGTTLGPSLAKAERRKSRAVMGWLVRNFVMENVQISEVGPSCLGFRNIWLLLHGGEIRVGYAAQLLNLPYSR